MVLRMPCWDKEGAFIHLVKRYCLTFLLECAKWLRLMFEKTYKPDIHHAITLI